MFFIIAGNCNDFRVWANTTVNNVTNGDMLFTVLTNIVLYIRSATDIKNAISEMLAFFKTKCGCACISTTSNNTMIQTNVKLASLHTQLQKSIQTYRLTRAITTLQTKVNSK